MILKDYSAQLTQDVANGADKDILITIPRPHIYAASFKII